MLFFDCHITGHLDVHDHRHHLHITSIIINSGSRRGSNKIATTITIALSRQALFKLAAPLPSPVSQGRRACVRRQPCALLEKTKPQKEQASLPYVGHTECSSADSEGHDDDDDGEVEENE